MKQIRSIGGYFGLEIKDCAEYHNNAVRLNTARNCLRYLIRLYGIKEIYVPGYTCPVIWDAIDAEGCKMKYYSIGYDFMPTESLPTKSYILYTNYFGICSENIKILSEQYPFLIIDNSQSFYSGKMGLASFNSARKFFGVSDGAYLFTNEIIDEHFDKDISLGRVNHLLARSELGAQAGYEFFKENERGLGNEEIKFMSHLTFLILKSIDYKYVAQTRRDNFFALHKALRNLNQWNGSIVENDIPMIYPFVYKSPGLRQKLISRQIFIASYWKGQRDEKVGRCFEDYLFPLPIDQRYNLDDMSHIINTLKNVL